MELKMDEKALEVVKNIVEEFGKGRRQPNDPFFRDGNKACRLGKVAIVDVDEEDLCHEVLKKFKCDVPSCILKFDNLLNYELHYNSCHRYSCSQCKKQLPSPHLLDLHLSEKHDSFFLAQSERKPMYRCFVENCPVVNENPDARKKHCIEAHKFPHDFKFESKPKKASKPKVNSKTNKKPKNKDQAMEVDGEPDKDKAKAKDVKFKGPFTFGHKMSNKTFIEKKCSRKNTKIEMSELMDSLPPAE